MSDPISIPFPESTIITAVEVYLNREFFKQPHKITGIVAGKDDASFIVTAEPLKREPRESKSRKPKKESPPKRGLAGPVLTPPVVNGRETEVGAE